MIKQDFGDSRPHCINRMVDFEQKIQVPYIDFKLYFKWRRPAGKFMKVGMGYGGEYLDHKGKPR